MQYSVQGRNEIPINVDKDNVFFCCGLEFIEEDPYREFFKSNTEYLEVFPYDEIIKYCPFCGKKVFICKFIRAGRWKKRKTLCDGFSAWFNQKELKAPTRMFEYDHRNNQFYLHNRRGFGEGFTLVKYCIYCGEPLSEMIEKHGLPDTIKDSFHTDEWWKKRGL
jgi:hypothetical protein